MNNLAELIDRGVREKGVSREETERIAAALPTLEGKLLGHAILVIGYSFDPAYRKVIEPYLYYENKPSIAVDAISTLAQKFNLAQEYISYVKEGLKGFDWDEFGYVRDECLITAAHILRDQPQHRDLAEHIYKRLLANTKDDPDPYAADAAQIALGATSRDRAFTPFEGPPNLAEDFRRRFLATGADRLPAS